MILVVAKEGKIYYIREINSIGIGIKKNKANEFMICLDDRVEPIATYKKWENANIAMDTITQAYAKSEKIVVISPND